MTCLHRGRAATATLGDVAAVVDVADLPRLRRVVGSLPNPDRCSDLTALAITTDPPPPGARAIGERLAQAALLGEAGKIDDALLQVDAAVAEARTLDFGPLRAESLLTQGLIRINAEDRTAAVPSLREAVDIAMSTGADEIAVEAWGQLEWAWATGSEEARAQPLEGRALILRLAERRPLSRSTATLYHNLAGATEDPMIARQMYQRAAEISTHLGPAAADLRAMALLNLGRLASETPEREGINAEAVALLIAVAGPEHPRTIGAREMQAVGRIDTRAAAEQLDEVCIDVARFLAHIPGEIASCERQRALLHEMVGNTALANAATRRWVEHVDGSEAMDSDLAHGMAALRYGDADEAAGILTRVVARYTAIPERQWWEDLQLGEAELALGRAWRRLGRDDADTMLAGALRRLEGDGSEQRPPVTQRCIQLARRMIDRTLPSAAGG